MKAITLALAALAVLGTSVAAFAAETKKCKAGKVLDVPSGTCVTKRGS